MFGYLIITLDRMENMTHLSYFKILRHYISVISTFVSTWKAALLVLLQHRKRPTHTPETL